MTADQIRSLQPALAALLATFRSCFGRASTFAHWERYLLGLMADLQRKSIEPIAARACADPAQVPALEARLGHFLTNATWSVPNVVMSCVEASRPQAHASVSNVVPCVSLSPW